MANYCIYAVDIVQGGFITSVKSLYAIFNNTINYSFINKIVQDFYYEDKKILILE